MRIEDVYPLAVSVEDRTRPEQWLPDLSDETGRASRIWEAMLHLKLGAGRWAGKEFGLYAQEWQRRFVFAVYGPKPEDETRRAWVSEVFLTCSKKNAKTQLTGLMLLAQMLVEPEADARYLLVAGSKQQAGLLFSAVQAACEQDQRLLREVNVRGYKSDIQQYATGATLKTIALDLEATVGEIPQAYAVDEVHIVTRNRKAAGMIRQLASGLVASGGVGFYCSTAPLPSETSAGLYATLRNRSRSILSGEHEAAPETLLPVCFEPLPEQDLDNPDLWFRSNPSIDVTVPKAWLMQQHAIAKANRDPRELEDFYSQHVNAIRDTSAVGIDGWPPAREWSRWVDPGFDIDRLLDRAESTYAAVDAGGMDDLSALVVVVRDSSGRFYVWSHAWLTRHGYGAWPKNQPLYDQAVQMGELTITVSPGEDVAAMVRVIQNLPALKGIGLDPHGIQELLAALQERGHEPVGVPQGYRLSSHAEAAERAFFSDLVTVPDYPLMRWCIGNLRQRDTGTGAKSFTKPSGTADGPEKIDIGIAMFMAWAMLSVAPPVFDPRAMIA